MTVLQATHSLYEVEDGQTIHISPLAWFKLFCTVTLLQTHSTGVRDVVHGVILHLWVLGIKSGLDACKAITCILSTVLFL